MDHRRDEMEIRADKTSLFFGEDAVRWVTPYLTPQQLRAIIAIWPQRLQQLSVADTTLLPYSISDEFVDAFEATLTKAGTVSLRAVVADCIGFDPNEDDPVVVMGRNLPVVERREELFGEYERDVLLRALKGME